MVKKGGFQRDVTKRLGAFEEDLFGGDHGEAAADVFVDGVAELGPGATLDGTFAETGVGELTGARGGGDLDLVSVVVELVLNYFLDAVLVRAYDLSRREEEVQILAVILLQLAPPQLRRFRRRHRRNPSFFSTIIFSVAHCNSETPTPRETQKHPIVKSKI
ncbi:hypothetical protein V8G54_012262 [Vigna mungo]|uniref:Uncharacterized protein n=1 Tax=Vigna mungo TaxID=3915 RepID=A0AAQ3NQY9_VIGMU